MKAYHLVCTKVFPSLHMYVYMLAPLGKSNTITGYTGSGDSHRMPLRCWKTVGSEARHYRLFFSPAITSFKGDEEFQGIITDSLFLSFLNYDLSAGSIVSVQYCFPFSPQFQD